MQKVYPIYQIYFIILIILCQETKRANVIKSKKGETFVTFVQMVAKRLILKNVTDIIFVMRFVEERRKWRMILAKTLEYYGN